MEIKTSKNNKAKTKVIVFSGIDGSGKTTHALHLKIDLKNREINSKYVWMRGVGKALFSIPFLALCRLIGITKIHKIKKGLQISEYPFYAYKPIKFIWPWLQLLDSFFYSIIHVFIPKIFFKKIIIIERSAIDTFVDILAVTHYPPKLKILQNLFISLIPKNSLIIILDLDEKIAMARKGDILHTKFLTLRRKIYKNLCKQYGWYLISTEKPYDQVHKLIIKLVENTVLKE